MTDSEKSKYKLRGSKTPGQVVDEVVLSSERILKRDGDSVELSDAEHERLSKKYVLHKTSGPSRGDSGGDKDKTKREDGE